MQSGRAVAVHSLKSDSHYVDETPRFESDLLRPFGTALPVEPAGKKVANNNSASNKLCHKSQTHNSPVYSSPARTKVVVHGVLIWHISPLVTSSPVFAGEYKVTIPKERCLTA